MTAQAAAEALLATFRTVYASRMTAAALVGGDKPLEEMTDARNALIDMLGCTSLQAANMVRAIHVDFCRSIGHEVPADYVEGEGRSASLVPQSLYEDQRTRRVAR